MCPCSGWQVINVIQLDSSICVSLLGSLACAALERLCESEARSCLPVNFAFRMFRAISKQFVIYHAYQHPPNCDNRFLSLCFRFCVCDNAGQPYPECNVGYAMAAPREYTAISLVQAQKNPQYQASIRQIHFIATDEQLILVHNRPDSRRHPRRSREG